MRYGGESGGSDAVEPEGNSSRCSTMDQRPLEKTATEARQAVKVGPMRYVLGIGIAGALIGLLLSWLYFST
jgi:hypothetical protein